MNMVSLVLFFLLSRASATGGSGGGGWGESTPCSTDINTPEEFNTHKSMFDLILDVRNENEYLGNGAETSSKDPMKFLYGHHTDMWMLANSDRSDKAAVYKVDGKNTVDDTVIESLRDCYENVADTIKIAISCHSGSRSGAFQDALVNAGFKCENIYNVVPGAKGLYEDDNATFVQAADQRGPWSCAAAPVTSETLATPATPAPPDSTPEDSAPAPATPALGIAASCSTDINSVEEFYAQNSMFDLILDVRNENEYLGNGAETSSKDPMKFRYGHHTDMWMLVNSNRSDKAAVYKVDGKNTVDDTVIESLRDCYENVADTIKIAISCHSGSRSGAFQDALVTAGFKCENIYNVVPGAKGLYEADNTTFVQAADQRGPWSCAAAPVTSEPAATPTPDSTSEDASGAAGAFAFVPAFGFVSFSWLTHASGQ